MARMNLVPCAGWCTWHTGVMARSRACSQLSVAYCSAYAWRTCTRGTCQAAETYMYVIQACWGAGA
jgi:hypothetical protein